MEFAHALRIIIALIHTGLFNTSGVEVNKYAFLSQLETRRVVYTTNLVARSRVGCARACTRADSFGFQYDTLSRHCRLYHFTTDRCTSLGSTVTISNLNVDLSYDLTGKQSFFAL